MMYLKQFPDICREMGFDVEEKAKTIGFSFLAEKARLQQLPIV